MSIYNKLRNLLLFFYPARCINCGKLVNDKYPFCNECLKIFKPKRRERFIEVNSKKIKCISAFHYEGKIRESICDFKFRDRKSYSKFFAESISKIFACDDKIEDFDYITAVPLSKQRYKERGYNQAEIVAKDLGKIINVEYFDILKKVKNNKIQHTLNLEERKNNVKNVYDVQGEINIKDKKIIICDDIITSGNTLAECVRVLLELGAVEVVCVTSASAS